MRKKITGLSQPVIILVTVILVGLVVWDLVAMYNIARDQGEDIGRVRIQSVTAGFQKSLSRAESTFERVSAEFEELLLGDATEEEIRHFLSEQREMEYTLSQEHCLNIFCAVDGVVMISDMDTPDDYVLEERSWYRALMTKKKGEVYISPAYEDAWTDNMCITMARMLDDGVVVGIDYSVSEIQACVEEMSADGYGDAMIIDESGTIVGYTDPDMIGKSISDELPQYRDAFLRAVAADEDSIVLYNGMGIQRNIIFSSRTENDWYMMCSVSSWNLYREGYLGILRNSVLSVLFILAVVVFYFRGLKSKREDVGEEIPQVQKRKIKTTEKEYRSYQIGITFALVSTMVIVIIYTVNTTINGSISNMEAELQEYNEQVEDWVLEQKSILDVFDSVVTEDPGILNDYDETAQYLEDIARYFPNMDVVLIANPDFAHGHSVVANNGWVPGEDYVVEARPWYIGALTSRDFNITGPYYEIRTDEYSVTFSKVVESKRGEFYGVFAINFYADMLRDILHKSRTESGYAFLVNADGMMMGHPNLEYHQSDEESVNIHDLVYDKLYSQSGLVTLKDYDGEYKVCLAMDDEVSGFRLIIVRNWWDIYGSAIQYAILFLLLLGGCILIVNLVISRMIRWQRNANDELKKAADSAIQGEKAKSLFLSNMSHEIRTPINAILGMNEMILREYTDPQLLTYSGNIQSSGRTLLTLINDILDMSKIESGKMEIIPTEYKTADLFLDLWNVIYMRAENKSLTVSFSVDEMMPGTLYGDDVRVKQIVTNILTNAVKYTIEGGVKLRAAYEKHGDDMITLVVSVEDTGIGIKEEDQDKLFDNFQRLDEKKNRNIEGTGLGMSITVMLLKLMDGDIEVQSVYHEGSTFTVRIPQKVMNDEPVGDFESIRNNRALANAKNYDSFEAPGANVLVVDDNPLNLVVFTSFLKLAKMNIVTAESGHKCLELVKEQPFHIIFMDHMMPNMDGVETLHEIRKMEGSPNEKTPVIALTANAVAGAREYYLNEGFDDFLTKPIDSDKLEEMVIAYLPAELVHKKEAGAEESRKEDDAKAEGSRKEDDAAGKSGAADYSRYEEYGVSIKKGISNAAGIVDMYLNIMGIFIRDQERKVQLKQFMTDGNSHDYGILVHALKGDARMLGAESLADIAFEHEKQSKAGNLAYVEEHWDELVECWEKALIGFKEFYRESGMELEEDSVPAASVTDDDDPMIQITPEEITEVVSWIDAFKTEEAVERMKEWMQGSLSPEQRTLIESALTAIEEEYDEDKAIEILTNC